MDFFPHSARQGIPRRAMCSVLLEGCLLDAVVSVVLKLFASVLAVQRQHPRLQRAAP